MPGEGRHAPLRRKLSSIFLKGLFAVLPILVTVSLLVWLVSVTESLFREMLRWLLPDGFYLPGMGLFLAIALIFVAGLAMQGFVSRQLLLWIERSFNRIPLVKSVYGSVRDFVDLLSNHDDERFGGVVMVELPNAPMRLIGFITLQDLSALDVAADDDAVAVYLPMSYQIGGYTVFVSRRNLTPLDMKVEDAMRFVVTAGLSRVDETADDQDTRGKTRE